MSGRKSSPLLGYQATSLAVRRPRKNSRPSQSLYSPGSLNRGSSSEVGIDMTSIFLLTACPTAGGGGVLQLQVNHHEGERDSTAP